MVPMMESIMPSFMLGIGIGIIGLMSGIISLFLMAPHAEHVRPRSLRLIVKLFHSSILLFLIGVLLSITFFVLYIRGAKLILPIQSFAYIALYIDLLGWLLLSLGVTAFYREWIERSVELSLKLRVKETEIETKAGTGLDIPKPEEIPPFIIDELRKDIKTINQKLEGLKIPSGVIKEVKPRKGIPETLKQEIELIQAKIELTRDFYGLEKPVWYFMKLGNFYFESKDYEKAIEQYKAVLEKEPENDDALFNRGRAHGEKGDFDKAIEDYDLYLEKINPRNAAAYYNRGLAYAKKGEFEIAIEDCNKAIGLNPEYADAYNNRGVAYVEKREFEIAIEDYNKAIELNPEYALAYNNRGKAYRNLKQYERAIEDYNKAIELNPEYALAYNNRGKAYRNLKQYERAIEDYNKAIGLNPEYAGAYNNRGTAYRNLKQYERAIEDYNKAIELNPEYAAAYNNRGNAYDDLKQYGRAIEDYSRAIELNPEYAAAYTNRGSPYGKLKQYDKQQEDYKKALELDPNHIGARLNFSESYIITKNYISAHEMAEKALNIAEESKDVIISHFLMVCSALFQNKNEDAKSQLNILTDYLETIKDWTLTWDFSDVTPAIKSSDLDEDARSLMLSLIELLENKITLDEFKHIFTAL